MEEFIKCLVRGFNWKARMSNGAEFAFWIPTEITRKEAMDKLLEIANPEGEQVYKKEDIESIWQNKNIQCH